MMSPQQSITQWIGKHVVVSSILVFAVIGGAGYWLTQGMVAELNIARQELHTLQQRAEQRQVYITAVEQLLTQTTSIAENDKRALEQVVPDTARIPELIVELNELVTQNNFRIESLALNQDPRGQVATSTTALASVPITIKVAGPSYSGFKRLLGSIEEHIRIMNVTGVYFTPDSDQYTVNLVTYFKP